MNGKTHQITGVASALLTTCGCIWLTRATTPTATGTSIGIITQLVDLIRPPQELLPPSTNGNVVGNSTSSLTSVVLTIGLIMLIGLISGQLPDIDTPNSTIANSGRAMGRMLGSGSGHHRHRHRHRGLGQLVVGWLLAGFFWLVNLLPYTTAKIANRFFGHRGGIIHGLVGLFGSSLVASLISAVVLTHNNPNANISSGFGFGFNMSINVFYGLIFFAGYSTHLMVDTLSKSGVKWFWPLSDKSYHLLPKGFRFDTGNAVHNGITQASAILVTLVALVGLLVLTVTLAPV